jgi:hypothetical protein
MKHINSTFINYIKNTNELQSVLQNDFSSFQVSHSPNERVIDGTG